MLTTGCTLFYFALFWLQLQHMLHVIPAAVSMRFTLFRLQLLYALHFGNVVTQRIVNVAIISHRCPLGKYKVRYIRKIRLNA